MLLAVGIIDRCTTLQLLLTVASIVEAGRRVALLIAFAIHEATPALWSSAIGPRIDAQRAIVAIEIAGICVALGITDAIALLLGTSAFLAHGTLLLEICIVFAPDGQAIVGANTAAIAIGHTGTHIAGIIDLTAFARPLAWAEAFVVTEEILTGGALQTRIR